MKSYMVNVEIDWCRGAISSVANVFHISRGPGGESSFTFSRVQTQKGKRKTSLTVVTLVYSNRIVSKVKDQLSVKTPTT